MKDMLQRRSTTHTSQHHPHGISSSSASVGSSSSGSGSGGGGSRSGGSSSSSSGSSSGGGGSSGVWQTVPSSNVTPTDNHQSNPHQSNPDQSNPGPPPVSYPNTDALTNTLAIAKTLTMTLLPQPPLLEEKVPPPSEEKEPPPSDEKVPPPAEKVPPSLLYFPISTDDDLISPLPPPDMEVGAMMPFAALAITEFSSDLPPVVTIFSAPNYCDRYENKAAILRIDVTLEAFRVIQVDSPPPPLLHDIHFLVYTHFLVSL